MKIIIDNRDLAFTIDSYQTFAMDEEESIIEWLNGENDTNLTYDDIDWSYDHKGYLEHLSEVSVSILEQGLKDDVIKGIKLIDQKSPTYYNYTTDSYTAEWDINLRNLKAYISKNQEEYNSFEEEHWYMVHINHNTRDYDKEAHITAMLDFYTRKKYASLNYVKDSKAIDFDDEGYILEMYENIVASNYIDYEIKEGK